MIVNLDNNCSKYNQSTQPRQHAPILRLPNPKYSHAHNTPNPIQNHICILRATHDPTTAGSTNHQHADTRSTLPHINQQNKANLKKTTHLSQGNSASRIHDAKSTRTRYGATDKTL